MFITSRFALFALNDGAATGAAETGFASRVEDYGETEGESIASYDPDETPDLFDEDGEGSTQENPVEGVTGDSSKASPKDKPAQESSFSPYEFKGKVNGEEIAQKFESKKDLDLAIARGIQAPKIYEALQAAKKDIATLKEDAEWAKDLQGLAKESPQEFFENVVEELMSEEQLAEYVYNKYQYFAKLANMSPEERANAQKLKAADKLVKEQAYAEEKRKEAEAASAKARVEQEKAQLIGWKNKEIAEWSKKIPLQHQPHLEEYMRTVMLTAQAHLNAGSPYGLKDMSAHLKRLLTPLVSTQSPSQSKKEEANRNAATAEANKQKLQSLAAQGEGQQAPSKKLSRQDVWKKLKGEVLSTI